MNLSTPGSGRVNVPAWQDELVEAPAPGGSGPEIDLRSIIRLLRRQMRLILLTIAVILVATSAVVFSLTPSYQASALVLVDPSRKNLLEPDAQLASASSDSAKVDSEVEILKSDGILIDVINSQNLVTDPEFGVKLGLRDKVMGLLRLGSVELPTGREALGMVRNNLRKAISVQRRGLTYLISVDVRSTSPDKAAVLANAVVQAYIQRQVSSKVDATLASRDAIRDQIERARLAVVDAETQYNRYVSDNLDQLITVTGQADLREMRDTLQRLTTEQQATSAAIQSLRQGLDQQNYSALTDQLQSDAAQELARQRRSVLAALGQTTPGSAEAVNLRDELAKVETSLATEAQTRVSELESTLSGGESQLTDVRQNLNTALLRANLPPDIQARIYELLQVSRNATTNYQTLLSRLQDLETQSLLQVADSRVVSPALAPTAPSFPNTPLILAIAGLFAVGAGVGLGFLFDNFVGGFISAEQLQAVTGRRPVAVIPLQKKDANQVTVADTLVTRPISRYAESVRRLRAAIDRATDSGAPSRKETSRGAVIMVTSALPSEGKTTVSLSLARTYAADGLKVLLVDADLRRPNVHRQLGIEAKSSLADFLGGEMSRDTLQSIVVNDPQSSLRVIPGKRQATAPTDRLLKREPFAQLVETAARIFDVVILDSPPIEPVVDGLYIAGQADVIAFIVRAASTPQSSTIRALDSLSESKRRTSEILIALNQENAASSAYYGGYGGYYSD